ncbi:class I SAM-dependent methyltransferase [Microvirga pudoricolor]|uniref:class I SAM-dependent methyltransferase n=1 Tax=Microvirga pudoricolor TaxID=2778729 RepID=UPI001E5A9F79|nr:class I SAM-dependent methyltransferase [Microvirga pudoricolor]MBM6593780.1 class I SAM-dependent methyltransferase [Microvirga pudoricolor]
MSAQDKTTIDFYASDAEAYANRDREVDHDRLGRFLESLPKGAAILELGCGGGQDSEAMLARGFDVTPTDGTPEIAAQAETRLGRPVRVLLFGDLDEAERYDGVWANACLLHVPRDELGGIVGRIHRALRSGGEFHASFKAGEAEGRDRFERYFNYPTADWLREVYDPDRWASLNIEGMTGSGYDGVPTEWLMVRARKA